MLFMNYHHLNTMRIIICGVKKMKWNQI